MTNSNLRTLPDLTTEQLRGAKFVLDLLATSPAIRGRGREVLLDLHEELAEVWKRRAQEMEAARQ